ncbi:MAG: hypothetical protein ACK463_28805, partial [Bradyrhizobium sp.]
PRPAGIDTDHLLLGEDCLAEAGVGLAGHSDIEPSRIAAGILIGRFRLAMCANPGKQRRVAQFMIRARGNPRWFDVRMPSKAYARFRKAILTEQQVVCVYAGRPR